VLLLAYYTSEFIAAWQYTLRGNNTQYAGVDACE
jgi:hypothetical protein